MTNVDFIRFNASPETIQTYVLQSLRKKWRCGLNSSVSLTFVLVKRQVVEESNVAHEQVKGIFDVGKSGNKVGIANREMAQEADAQPQHFVVHLFYIAPKILIQVIRIRFRRQTLLRVSPPDDVSHLTHVVLVINSLQDVTLVATRILPLGIINYV